MGALLHSFTGEKSEAEQTVFSRSHGQLWPIFLVLIWGCGGKKANFVVKQVCFQIDLDRILTFATSWLGHLGQLASAL